MFEVTDESGVGRPVAAAAVALVVLAVVAAAWAVSTTSGTSDPGDAAAAGEASPAATSPVSLAPDAAGDADGATCRRSAADPGPLLDLPVQASRGRQRPPFRSPQEVDDLIAAAERAGAGVISTSASFFALKPTRTGPWRFDGLDRVLEAARARDLAVKLRMTGVPGWALDGDRSGRLQPPQTRSELRRWQRYVRTVLRHVTREVGADVAYVEVWNEPNSERYWPPGPDPTAFTRLLHASTQAVRSVSPETEVISGGLLGNDLGFLEAVYDAVDDLGLDEVPFDLVGVEPFNDAMPPDRVESDLRYEQEPFGLYDANFTGYISLHQLSQNRGDDADVYITLFGYSTQGDRDTPPTSDGRRAGYATAALRQATCSPFVRALSWYALHPSVWDPPQWTLLDEAGTPNATYAALERWAARAP